MDTEKQRQRRHDDTRLAESGNARSEQLLVMPTESLTNQRMAARRALERIGKSKARPVFRYEVSDLLTQPLYGRGEQPGYKDTETVLIKLRLLTFGLGYL